MKKTILSQLTLGVMLSFAHIQASNTQESTGPSAAELEKINELKPTLNQIKNVKVPWGLNLCLVEERGKQARKLSIDQYDFSSRITLLQKHKAKAQQLSKEIEELSKQISQFAQLNVIMRNLKKTEIEQAQEKMNTLKEEVKNNAIKMNAMTKTVKNKTGLTDDEIIALPDSNKWNGMKATECANYNQTKNTEAPTKREAQAPQRPQWKRAQVPIR